MVRSLVKDRVTNKVNHVGDFRQTLQTKTNVWKIHSLAAGTGINQKRKRHICPTLNPKPKTLNPMAPWSAVRVSGPGRGVAGRATTHRAKACVVEHV